MSWSATQKTSERPFCLPDVTIKSSGSDFLGRSSAYSSFSINLMLMNDMEVNNRTTPRSEHGEIKVQSGATWSEIFKEVC